MTMTDEESAQANKYAEKIAMLLRKAESTTPEEAESIMATVQRLMTQYAIDEQMIALAAGTQVQEKIIEGTYKFTGIFQATSMNLAFAVARHNNCKAFFHNNSYAKPKNHSVHFFGFESDVHNVQLLTTSLEIQMTQAMLTWAKGGGIGAHDSKMQMFKKRREFIDGFCTVIGNRLYAAAQEGRRAAEEAEAERSSTTVEAAAKGVELVLLDRKAQVHNWFDEQYGRSLRKVSRRYSSSGDGGSSRAAGATAARTANIGQPAVGGSKKAIGR